MTIDELIGYLEQYDGDVEVRIAHQPSWPFEYSIGQIVATDQRYTFKPSPDEVEEHGIADGWFVVGPDFALDPDSDVDTDEPLAGPFETEREAERWQDENPPIVYIGEGTQLDYLPGEASSCLGWR